MGAKKEFAEVEEVLHLEEGDIHRVVLSGHLKVMVKIAQLANGERAVIIETLGKAVPEQQFSVGEDGVKTPFVSEDDGTVYFPSSNMAYPNGNPQVVIDSTMHPGGYRVQAISAGQRQVIQS